jgi:hypothetical protein
MPSKISENPPLVLCLGSDQRLLEIRGRVLATHYGAVSLGNIEELDALPATKQFDVVVLCHSLSSEQCDMATTIVRERWPKAKIVALSREGSSFLTAADQTIRSLDGPSVLLQAIDGLLA